MNDILIVDDEKDIRELIGDILKDEGYDIRLAANSDECMNLVAAQPPGMMVLDIWLKDSQMDGIDILKTVKRDHPDIPIVIISGHGNIEIAVAAIKQGAYDFIEKPFNIDQLMVVISRATETARLRRENADLRRSDPGSADMIGQCAVFKTMKAQLDKVTRSNGRVMLSGPGGVGKDLAARYIHAQSNRSDNPFVTVSPSGMDKDTVEVQLFGRETPGQPVEPGLLEQADGGVIYFDEIADLPADVQPRLLRVLVDQAFQRVGGRERLRVDLRVISSTARDLEAEIAAGRFRQELYHRLNVVPIEVPSLEERREDIPVLAAHFIAELHRSQGLPDRALSEEAGALLQTMIWPGNLRQLKNVIERVLILGPDSGAIEVRELPGDDASAGSDDRVVLSGRLATLPLREARELFEREYLMTQINRFGGNISRTASFVGMERSALHRKLKSLGVVTTTKSGARVARVEEAGADGDAQGSATRS